MMGSLVFTALIIVRQVTVIAHLPGTFIKHSSVGTFRFRFWVRRAIVTVLVRFDWVGRLVGRLRPGLGIVNVLRLWICLTVTRVSGEVGEHVRYEPSLSAQHRLVLLLLLHLLRIFFLL